MLLNFQKGYQTNLALLQTLRKSSWLCQTYNNMCSLLQWLPYLVVFYGLFWLWLLTVLINYLPNSISLWLWSLHSSDLVICIELLYDSDLLVWIKLLHLCTLIMKWITGYSEQELHIASNYYMIPIYLFESNYCIYAHWYRNKKIQVIPDRNYKLFLQLG